MVMVMVMVMAMMVMVMVMVDGDGDGGDGGDDDCYDAVADDVTMMMLRMTMITMMFWFFNKIADGEV